MRSNDQAQTQSKVSQFSICVICVICGSILEALISPIDSRRSFRSIEPREVGAERFTIEIGELGELIYEGEIDCVGGTVALLRNDQLGDVLVLFGPVVLLFAIDESDHVGVLLDR